MTRRVSFFIVCFLYVFIISGGSVIAQKSLDNAERWVFEIVSFEKSNFKMEIFLAHLETVKQGKNFKNAVEAELASEFWQNLEKEKGFAFDIFFISGEGGSVQGIFFHHSISYAKKVEMKGPEISILDVFKKLMAEVKKDCLL